MPVITSSIVMVGPPDGVPSVRWTGIAAGDTCTPYLVRNRYGFVGSIQISGTFGGATVTLEQSNDGVTYFPATDTLGSAISATAGEMSEMSLAAVYLKPVITGGSGGSISVIIVFRG